jgi:hypothetical protein
MIMSVDKSDEFFELKAKGIDPLQHVLKKRRAAYKAFLERELLVEKAGSKGWSITDDGTLISCHATSQDVMAEAFRLSERRDPPIKITVDCRGE